MCFPNDFDYFDFDYLDCPEKKISILSKKVNDLFVDRNVNVVSLPSKSRVIFLQPLRVTKFSLKGNEKEGRMKREDGRRKKRG